MRYDFQYPATLDASGFAQDQERPYSFPPPIVGTVIDTNSVVLTPEILRGAPELRNVNVTATAVSFTIFCPAAGGFPIGHHSGSMIVHVSFSYFDALNPMPPEQLRTRSEEAERARSEEADAERTARYLKAT